MFAEIFIVVKILKRFDLVDFLICPLEPTSKGTKKHLYPISSRSFFRVVYLMDFLKYAASAFCSKLHVNSSRLSYGAR